MPVPPRCLCKCKVWWSAKGKGTRGPAKKEEPRCQEETRVCVCVGTSRAWRQGGLAWLLGWQHRLVDYWLAAGTRWLGWPP